MGGKKDNTGRDLAAAAINRSDKAAGQYEIVDTPDKQLERMDPEEYKLLKELDPQLLEKSSMEGVSADQQLTDAQYATLKQLQDSANRGYSEEEMMQLLQAKNAMLAKQQAGDKAVLQNLAERGQLGSGQELIQRLSNAQAAAELGQKSAIDIGTQNLALKRQAAMDAASLAGKMEQTQFGQRSDIAKAKDAIAQINQKVSNEAAAQNLAMRQNISSQNIDMRNKAKQFNKELQQADFENKMRLQGAKAGALAGQANMLNQQAMSYVPRSGTSLLAPAMTLGGAAIGGAYGGAAGASIGASVGGAAGNMAESQMQRSEDGGVIESQKPETKEESDFKFIKTFSDNLRKKLQNNKDKDIYSKVTSTGVRGELRFEDGGSFATAEAPGMNLAQDAMNSGSFTPTSATNNSFSTPGRSLMDSEADAMTFQNYNPPSSFNNIVENSGFTNGSTVDLGTADADSMQTKNMLDSVNHPSNWYGGNPAPQSGASLLGQEGDKRLSNEWDRNMQQAKDYDKAQEDKKKNLKEWSDVFGKIAPMLTPKKDPREGSFSRGYKVGGIVDSRATSGGVKSREAQQAREKVKELSSIKSDGDILSNLYNKKLAAEKLSATPLMPDRAMDLREAGDKRLAAEWDKNQEANNNANLLSQSGLSNFSMSPDRAMDLREEGDKRLADEWDRNIQMAKDKDIAAAEKEKKMKEWSDVVSAIAPKLAAKKDSKEGTFLGGGKYENVSFAPFKAENGGIKGFGANFGVPTGHSTPVNNHYESTGLPSNLNKLIPNESEYVDRLMKIQENRLKPVEEDPFYQEEGHYENGGKVSKPIHISQVKNPDTDLADALRNLLRDEQSFRKAEKVVENSPDNRSLKTVLDNVGNRRASSKEAFEIAASKYPNQAHIEAIRKTHNIAKPVVQEAAEEGVRKSIFGEMVRGLAKTGAKKAALGATTGGLSLAYDLLEPSDLAAADLPEPTQQEQNDSLNKLYNRRLKEGVDENAKMIYNNGNSNTSPSSFNFEKGGIQDGNMYVDDQVPAKINSKEMVLNLAEQQKLIDALKGNKEAPFVGHRVDDAVNDGEVVINEDAQKQLFDFLSGKTEETPNKDLLEPADSEDKNIHNENKELKSRISVLEEMLKSKLLG